MLKNTLPVQRTVVTSLLLFFIFSIIIPNKTVAQNYQFGFETGASDSWVNNTSTTGDAVVSTVARTGTYSFKATMSSAGTNRGIKRSNITVTPSTNLYAIAWVKATNASTTAGMTLSGGATGLTNTAISNSAFTQVSVAYANANNTTRELRLYFTNASATETVYLDDIIVYASSNSTIDLVSPNAPTAVSSSYSGGSALLNWTSGGDDAGAGATGVQSTMVLKYTGTGVPTAPTLNNQAVYAVNDVPAIGWQVVMIGAAVSGSNVNVGAISANTTYAIYHRDFAYNWSAPTTTTVAVLSGTPPTVVTTVVSGITTANAVSGGNVTSEGSAPVTVKGIVFGTTSSTTSNPTNSGTGLGTYTSDLTGLIANTKYYYRAYAVNSIATSYGTENNFTALPNAPVIGTAGSITSTGFTANWSAPATQGSEAFTYTVEVDDDNTFSSINATYSGIGSGTLSQVVSGLSSNTTYYYRVRAINTTGTSVASATSAGVTTSTVITTTIPTVSTTAITTITNITASTGGSVTSDGGATVITRGVAYGITTTPTTANSITSNGTGTGTYTSSLSNLTANQFYYVRAYATNSVGTAYGTQQSFTTLSNAPVIGTASSITSTGFTASWSAPATQGSATFTYTVEVGDDSTFGSINATYSGISPATFSQVATGLSSGVKYYYRVRAINATGTSVASATSVGVTTLTTTTTIPTVTTVVITAITNTTATTGGNVTSDGGATVTARGVAYNTTGTPTTANSITSNSTGTGTYTSSLTSLTANQLYYVRAYATNSIGTAYGAQQSFTTLASAPTSKSSISFGTVTSTSLIVKFSGGNGTRRILVARSATSVSFTPTNGVSPNGVNANFLLATNQGSGNEIVYDGTGTTDTVTGLTPSTTYYFAVYEYNNNSAGVPDYYATAGTGDKKTSAPVLAIAFDATLTTPYLNPPYVSGVISDPTDPAQTTGIVVDVTNNSLPIAATGYTLTAASSETTVVPTANVVITQANGNATVKINPTGVGYSNITLTLTVASTTKTLVIDYAASAASSTPASTYWHTGYADASAAIRLDSNYMVIGDDEFNNLYVSDRNHSGLPVETFYFGDQVGLTDGSAGDYKEADIEASTPSVAYAGRSYWTGSMSNGGSSDKYEPDRNTLFATNITGTGAATSITVVGHYNNLLAQLVSWGDTNGYDLASSSAAGHDPKTIDGFNVEGMAIGPDNTTLYIGFRAPLVPTANRTNALIAPLLNFETWFNNGKPSGNPTFGAPIELNLGGRGIRDIVRLSNGDYMVIAGNYLASPLTGAIFKWTGKATDAPVQITNMDISALEAEACVEMDPNGQLSTDQLQIISDNGSYVFYDDGTEAKDLTEINYEKYRSDIIVSSGGTQTLRPAAAENNIDNNLFSVYPNPVVNGSFKVATNQQGIKQAKLFDFNGKLVKQFQFNSSITNVSTNGLADGSYQLVLINANGSMQTKKLLLIK